MLKNRSNLLKKPNELVVAVIVVLAVVLPFFLGEYYLDILIAFLINVIVVVSFRFITFTGGWSLAHIPLWGLGGYLSAIMAKQMGFPFWLTLFLAPIGVAIVAFVMSYPLSRIKGFAFFIASSAVGEAMRLSWTKMRVPFGGHGGLGRIPPPESLPGLPMVNFADAIPYYFLTLVVTALCLVIFYRLEKSRIGDTLKSIGMNETLVKSIGVNITKYKMVSFTIGSSFAGIAGVLLTHRLGAIDPSIFGFSSTMSMLMWVILGGSQTFAGPIVGVFISDVIIHNALRPFLDWLPMIYGVILIFILRFLPGGLESLPGRIKRAFGVKSAVA